MRFIRDFASLGILLVTMGVPIIAPVQSELKAIAQTDDDLRTQQITAASLWQRFMMVNNG